MQPDDDPGVTRWLRYALELEGHTAAAGTPVIFLAHHIDDDAESVIVYGERTLTLPNYWLTDTPPGDVYNPPRNFRRSHIYLPPDLVAQVYVGSGHQAQQALRDHLGDDRLRSAINGAGLAAYVDSRLNTRKRTP